MGSLCVQLQDKPEQDQSKIDALAAEPQWSTRIFDDRHPNRFRYVCEVPTIIEQRAFVLAPAAIRQALD